jgi:cytochrome c-type biogenesis protein CcmH
MVMTLLLAGIACAVLVLLVLPLLRNAQSVADCGHFDRVVYRGQLRELDRDVGRGLLTETEAASARLEIQRRLLAADVAPGDAPGRGGRSPVLASLVALSAVGGAVAV